MQTQITRTYLYQRTAGKKAIHGIYPPSTRTIMNAVNKQSIARSETTGYVTSVAMPTRKIASARTHARTHAART